MILWYTSIDGKYHMISRQFLHADKGTRFTSMSPATSCSHLLHACPPMRKSEGSEV